MPIYHATWNGLRGPRRTDVLTMADLVQASADAGYVLARTTIRDMIRGSGLPAPSRIGRGHFGYTTEHRDAVVAEARRRKEAQRGA